MSKQHDVNKSLYRVAGRCVNEGQYTLAISCFLAILGNDPVPDDYVLCSLDLARVYIEHTTNIEEAQKVLKQLLVRLKEDNTRVDERCSCCSLLIRACLESNDLQAAQKHCLRAFTILERSHQPMQQIHCWWLHFGCIAAVTSCQRLPHTVTGPRREKHLSLMQSWKACMEKAQQMLAGSPGHVTQLLCALLQAQLACADLDQCLLSLRQLQAAISRWQKDGSQQQLEVLGHALTLQAMLMVRESKLDTCWDVPLCAIAGQPLMQGSAAAVPAASTSPAGTDAGPSRPASGAATDTHAVAAAAGAAATPPTDPPQIATVLDDLTAALQRTTGAVQYNWLPMGQRAGLLMLMRSMAALSHHSSGADANSTRAIQYAETGLSALKAESRDGGGPFLSDLVIMLTGVIFLFNLTAFSGKDEEDHLHRAQRSLAAMQSLVHPPQATSGVANGGTSNSVDAASGAPCGDGMDGGAAAADACGAPTAAATFVRFCTATYAVCMGCMEDAVAILRQALRDAPMLEALAEANAPNGRVHPSHRLLLLLVLCTQVTALAECDTPAARTEAEALQPTIQRIAAASGNQADHILASLARARCWRRGREPHDEIAVGDPNFVDHRAAVMSAFQVSSEFTVPRTQLVVSALRALAPMLIATGDSAGADRALKSALTMLHASRDGTARVQVLHDYAALSRTDQRRAAIAQQRAVKYSHCIRRHLSSAHAALVSWGIQLHPA